MMRAKALALSGFSNIKSALCAYGTGALFGFSAKSLFGRVFANGPHANGFGRMLEKASLLLALGIPGFASDEHLSSTQPNDWSRHESA
jgi:hypothetical protein